LFIISSGEGLSESCRDTDAAFAVNGMFVSTTKHGFHPLSEPVHTTLSHFFPLGNIFIIRSPALSSKFYSQFKILPSFCHRLHIYGSGKIKMLYLGVLPQVIHNNLFSLPIIAADTDDGLQREVMAEERIGM